MTPQDIADRLAAIYEQKAQAVADLKQQVYQARTFADGAVLSRTRHNDDGSVYDHITGTVVGADAFEVDDTINIQYWVRVDSPVDYRSHQQCGKYNLPMHKAEDFWQGDERWQSTPERQAEQVSQCPHLHTNRYRGVDCWIDEFGNFKQRPQQQLICKDCRVVLETTYDY